MTDTDGIEAASADDAAAAAAAAAGVAELAAAAEIDAAEGDELLASFVRHEIALGHQLTMQFAAAGNAALDVALSNAAEDAAAKRADRMAARLGGASARVMGNVRLALLTLAGLPATAEAQWVGVRFENEAPCSPAEAERRLAAAKAARAAAQGPSVAAEAGAGARAATAAERECLADAHTAMAELAAEAGVSALADAAGEWGRIKGLVRHELAAAHRLVMRFGGRAGRLLAQAGPEDDRVEALRLASAAARLMARGRQALAMLARIGPGPDGGPGRVAGYYWDGERDMFANTNTPVGAPPSSGVTPGRAPRRGRGIAGFRTAAPSRSPEIRQPLWRLPRRPALRRPDARRLQLPPAGDGERPLPLPRRQEHGAAHRRRVGAEPRRPPHPRRLLGRDHRSPPGRRRPSPPRPRAARAQMPGIGYQQSGRRLSSGP